MKLNNKAKTSMFKNLYLKVMR